MSGIKLSQAMQDVPQNVNVEEIYKEYEESKKVTFVNENAFTVANLPFQPAPIEKDLFRVGRVVANPIPEMRLRGCDAKYVLKHDIVNSSGKYKAPVIFKSARDQHGRLLRDPDKSWILWRWLRGRNGIFDFVFDKSIPKGQEGRITFNNESHPLFAKYKENRAYPNEQYIVSASKDPREFILLNFIDRSDSWCKENKKTKVLASNFYQGESDGDKPAYVDLSPGISVYGVYDKLQNMINIGQLATKDIAIGKQKNKENNYEYVVGAFSDSVIPPNVQALGLSGNLSAEELEYDVVDFDPLFNESTYAYIMQHWGKDMERWDADFGTTFYQELVELVNEESGNDSSTIHTEQVSQSNLSGNENSPFADDFKLPVATQKQETKTEQQIVAAKASVPTQFDFSKWKHFSSLQPDQQQLLKEVIVGTDDKGNPIFKDEYNNGTKNLLTCVNDPNCVYVLGGKVSAWPEEVTKCPVCNEDF